MVAGAIAFVVVLSACESPPTFVFGVNSTTDAVDAVPGDGRCATSAPEVCTLRAAVMEANALGEPTQVLLPAGAVQLSLGPGDENRATSDDLDIRVPLRITGDPVTGSTIDAAGVGRVLDIISGTTTLTGVTLTGGSSPVSGGAVYVRTDAALVAEDVGIVGNTSGAGTGGLKIDDDASAELSRVTLSANTGSGNGAVVNAGTLVARNVTVSGNTSADGTGGGIATPAPGASTLVFVTVTANTGSGLDGNGTVTMTGSIVTDQTSGADCTGTPPTSTGHNLVGGAPCLAAAATGDVVGGGALGPLGDNGGNTPTHRPGPGSAAIDAIPVGTPALCDGTIATDQRGRTRPTVGGCDRGAVETGDLRVNRSTDAPDAAPGDGVCEASVGVGDCTMRAAVDEANATPGAQEVVLLTDVTLARPGADNTNANGDLDVSDALVVLGGGHTIDAGGIDRSLHATAPLTLERVTITGGVQNGPGAGAGVLASSDLTLRFATVRDNVANGGHGGGIAHSTGALLVEDSTIRDNRASSSGAVSGGGIRSSGGSATVLRSSITGNEVESSQGGGGGIARAGAPVTVSFSTISANRAGRVYIGGIDGDYVSINGSGGGGIAGPVVLAASTVSGNWSGGNGGGLAGAPITIRSSTISGNEARGGTYDGNTMSDNPSGTGGAVFGTPTVVGSTIAGNIAVLEFGGISGGSIAGSIHADSCAPSVSSAGWNVTTPDCALAGTGDVVQPGVPLVEALADNGGPTRTMLPTSFAIDTVAVGTPDRCDASTTLDQRVRPRPAGPACDAGSVERSAVSSVTVVTDDPGDARDAVPGDGICATLTGGCTLRAAIDEANLSYGADTITLGVDTTLSLAGSGEDANAGGDLDIASELAVQGGGHVVDAGYLDRVLHHHSGTVTINDLTLRRGTLHGSDRTGGLVESAAAETLTIASSTLVDGDAGAAGRGGAVHKTGGTLSIVFSTVTGTSAGAGAAVAVDGATTNVIDATIAVAGPGPAITGDAITARRSIIASDGGSACESSFGTSQWNLVTDASCGPALVVDPQLGPLADNGGLTPTRLPAPGSLAVNAIPVGEPDACDATRAPDQRGVARPQGPGCDIGATEDDDGSSPPINALVVDRATEEHDAVPGDGACAIAGGGCTLRAAIDEANARPGAERIELTVDVTMALAGTDDDLNVTGDFDLRSPLVIDGGGHTVDAAGLDRVFDAHETLELTDLEITGGYMEQYPGLGGVGGGVRFYRDLTVRRSEIVGNRSVRSDGGGISVARQPNDSSPRPVVRIEDSTIATNQAPSDSGLNLGWAQSATVLRSTISGNVGYATINGPIHLVASTVVDNDATMALGTSVLDVAGSIVSGNRGLSCAAVYGRPTSLGHNIADSSCAFVAAGDVTVDDLPVSPLADNGGPTRTHLTYVGGPAIDAIAVGTPGLCDAASTQDQRGVARPTGPRCDIGATEGGVAAPAEQVLVVNSGADLVDLVPGDGVCSTSAGTCTLRAAVSEGNARPGRARIQLQVDVLLTRVGRDEDTNATGDLDVTDRTRIEGADRVVDAGGLDHGFDVRSDRLELARVRVRGAGGNGVRAVNGSVMLDRSSVSGSRSTGIDISNSMLEVQSSTISGNGTPTGPSAGGISVSSSVGRVEASTISGNLGGLGAGVRVSISRLDLRRSTLVGNAGSATILGQYYGDLGSVRFAATVISAPGGACTQPTTSLGWNVVSDATCGASGPGDQQGAAITVGPLQANGGPTHTHLLGLASPMVDAIPVGTAGLCDASTSLDQRGVARPAGAGCDVGSVEGTVAPGAGAPVSEEPIVGSDDGAVEPVPNPDPSPPAAVPSDPGASTDPVPRSDDDGPTAPVEATDPSAPAGREPVVGTTRPGGAGPSGSAPT